MIEKKIIKSAIYTRKSSEEGLDLDFNSLDARERLANLISKAKNMKARC